MESIAGMRYDRVVRSKPEPSSSAALPTCALEGCQVPVVRKPGGGRGGRPRLYCSDAHRAEARRRRLGAGSGWLLARATPPAGDGPAIAIPDHLDRLRTLLAEALSTIEVAARDARVSARPHRDEVLIATIRAETTAEVLRAHQAAADATRHAAAAEHRLEQEREDWRAALDGLASERGERERVIDELTGALEGARAELETELLRHHADAERTDALLQAQGLAHETQVMELTEELDQLRDRLTEATVDAEESRHRAARAEQLLEDRSAELVALEVRAARADEQARQVAERLDETKGELERVRRELADERRRRRSADGGQLRVRRPRTNKQDEQPAAR